MSFEVFHYVSVRSGIEGRESGIAPIHLLYLVMNTSSKRTKVLHIFHVNTDIIEVQL